MTVAHIYRITLKQRNCTVHMNKAILDKITHDEIVNEHLNVSLENEFDCVA